jgi:quercetin dioxygenase-like cupin family protein
MRTEDAEYSAVMLAACPPGARRDVYRVRAQPGTPYLARPHVPGTCEHLILCTGRAHAGPDGEAVELAPGDYLRYPGDVPHVFDAQDPDTTAIIIMEDVLPRGTSRPGVAFR